MEAVDIEILKKVEKFFGLKITDINSCGSGVNSSAFLFVINKNKFILRISSKNDSFVLDKYISTIIPTKIVPTPKTHLLGECNKLFFSVTKYCHGKLMFDMDEGSQLSLIQKYLDVSHNLHSFLSPPTSHGYGNIDNVGNGIYSTWNEFLESQKQINSKIWPERYFEKLNILKNKYLKYTSKKRSIIHGDYGYKNIINHHGKISGVIDWGDAKYGDFVYDIAYISFWSKNTDYLKLFYKHYLNKNVLNLDNFNYRIHCYTFYIAISLLNYFAKNKDSESFNWIKGKIDQYISQNSLV